MSLYFHLSELMPTTHECWCYRYNSKKRWTRYYMALKNKIVYFFPSPTSIVKKSTLIEKDCTFVHEKFSHYPLTIKITYPDGKIFRIAFERPDDVKSLLYYFNQIKTVIPINKKRKENKVEDKERRGTAVNEMIHIIPSTRRIRSFTLADKNEFIPILNGRINVTELRSLISWIRNDKNSMYDEFLRNIPLLSELNEGDMIDFKIDSNEIGEEIELNIISKAILVHDTLKHMFDELKFDEKAIQIFDTIYQNEIVENYLLISKKGGKRFGWRKHNTQKSFEDDILKISFDHSIKTVIKYIEKNHIGNIISYGKTMNMKDKQINEITCEIAGNPNVKWNKLKKMTEEFDFQTMKNKIDFVKDLHLFQKVNVVFQSFDNQIIKMKVIVEKMDEKAVQSFIHPLNWLNQEYFRSCSIQIRSLQMVETHSSFTDDGFTNGFQNVLQYDCGIERK